MLKISTRFLWSLSLLLLVFATGCKTKKQNIEPVYENYKFDNKVIEKLPLYDSLATAISGKVHLFHKNIDSNASFQAFRYMPASTEAEVFKTLPAEIGIDMNRYFSELGKDFIYAFDVFRDSTIKIYVRNYRLEKTEVDVAESLSYYPAETNIRHREYPDKDTVLNKHWQYWVRFTTESLF
jgi:hypothetical protein